MAKNEKITAADVVAEAEEMNLLHDVPAQTSPEAEEANDPKLSVIEGGKKSVSARLKALAEKVKANKKGVLITLAVVGAAAVTVAKFAAKTVVEEVVDSSEKAFEEAYSDKGDEAEQDDSNTEAA